MSFNADACLCRFQESVWFSPLGLWEAFLSRKQEREAGLYSCPIPVQHLHALGIRQSCRSESLWRIFWQYQGHWPCFVDVVILVESLEVSVIALKTMHKLRRRSPWDFRGLLGQDQGTGVWRVTRINCTVCSCMWWWHLYILWKISHTSCPW